MNQIKDDDDVTYEISLYENQRLYPIIGWSSQLLPYDIRYHISDRPDGTTLSTKEDINHYIQNLEFYKDNDLQYMPSQTTASGDILESNELQIWDGIWQIFIRSFNRPIKTFI